MLLKLWHDWPEQQHTVIHGPMAFPSQQLTAVLIQFLSSCQMIQTNVSVSLGCGDLHAKPQPPLGGTLGTAPYEISIC